MFRLGALKRKRSGFGTGPEKPTAAEGLAALFCIQQKGQRFIEPGLQVAAGHLRTILVHRRAWISFWLHTLEQKV